MEENLVKFIDEEVYEASEKAKNLYYKEWYFNLAYLLGKTDLIWFQNKLQTTPYRKDYVQSNILLQPFRALKAQYLKVKTTPQVIPENPDDERLKETARRGTKVLQALWKNLLVKEKLTELVWWFLTTGTAYLKVFWDKNIGTTYIDEEKGETWKKGDIGINVVNPFNIAIYPSVVSSEDDLIGICHYRVIRVDEIEKLYNKKIEPEKDLITTDIYLTRIFGNKAENSVLKNSVLLKEYWEKESHKYPRGRYIVVANKQVLESRENDFIDVPNYRIWSPLVKFTAMPVEGRYWGMSPIEQSRNHQKVYNRILNLLLKNIFLMGSIKWLVPRGASLSETALNTLVGEIIEYDYVGTIPSQSQPTSIPSYILVLLDKIKFEIEGIFSQHELKYPLRSRTATEVGLIRSLDEEISVPETQSFFTNLEKVGQLILFCISEGYVEEREIEGIKITGEDLKHFKDVYIETGVNLPHNKAVRQEIILNFYKTGLLGDPADDRTRKRTLKLMEFGNVDAIFQEEEEETEITRETPEGMEQKIREMAIEKLRREEIPEELLATVAGGE